MPSRPRIPKVFPGGSKPAPLKLADLADEEYGATATPDWRTVDWRAHLRQVEIGERRLNYVDIGGGDGPPVVFVHGLGGCWQNWLENLPRSSRERRCVALDLPGFGYSEMPREDISIPGYAGTVESLCEALGLDAVAVVGNSMGGFTAAEMAIRHPERVERLVLVDAAGITVNDISNRPTVALGRLLAALGAPPEGSNRLPRRPGTLHLAFRRIMRHPTRLRRDLLAEQAAGSGRPGFLVALEALLGYDFRHRLPEIGCPTLIVQGAEDWLVPVEDAREFNRLIPDSQLLLMEDTGHVPMLERPNLFNAALLEFLTALHQPGEQDTRVGAPPERAF